MLDLLGQRHVQMGSVQEGRNTLSDSVLDRLNTALADRFRIEREIGSGGMVDINGPKRTEEGSMRSRRLLALLALTVLGTTACRDMQVTNPNEPDRDRAVAAGADVETLISRSFVDWWRTSHLTSPGANFSAAADAASVGWGNFGMKDFGQEPRQPFDNTPEYTRSYVAESPWEDSYAALTSVRDGFLAIQNGVRITSDGKDVTQRAVAFGQLVQAMTLSNLAVIFDKAFVVDETTNLDSLEAVPYAEVWQAALEKYDAAISTAQSTSFTIPASWVGDRDAWSRDDFLGLARAFRARYLTQIPRSPAERAAVDWDLVLADLSPGLPLEFIAYYDDNEGTPWWDRQKLHSGTGYGWARIDYRTVGPSDVSGAWEAWIAAPAAEKLPFDIVTPDSRITAPGDPHGDGKYVRYYGRSPWPDHYGVYHHSHYMDYRWLHLMDGTPRYTGDYPDFVNKEVDFLRAEAWYRLGQTDKAREIVSKYRANGDLPPFTGIENPDGPEICVPQMPDGSCGDLWEALKYEKRIELYHYSFGTEFFDDRGWGDLVEGTLLHLPIPGRELLILLEEIYTFGGTAGGAAPGGGSTPDLMDDFSAEGIHQKVLAYQRFREERREAIDPGPAY